MTSARSLVCGLSDSWLERRPPGVPKASWVFTSSSASSSFAGHHSIQEAELTQRLIMTLLMFEPDLDLMDKTGQSLQFIVQIKLS